MSSQFQLDTWRVASSGHWFIGVAGEVVSNRDAVRIGTNGRVYRADADLEATMPCMGIAITAASAAGVNISVLISGFVETLGNVWTAGGKLYVSTTPGALTQTAPNGAGDLVQEVGFAMNTTQIYFNPQLGGGELTVAKNFFLGGGDDGNLAGGTTAYYYPNGSSDNASILTRQIRTSFDCEISELKANINASVGAGETITFTLMVEGIASTLTSQIGGAADIEGQDLVNIVQVSEDDLISMRVVTSATATPRTPAWTMKVEPRGT